MRVENLNSDNNTIVKTIVNNGGKNMEHIVKILPNQVKDCLLYTSPSPRDGLLSRMPSSA